MNIGQKLRSIAAQVTAFASSNAADGLFVAGGGAVSYGAWLVYAPAGFIVGGVLAIAAGVMVARSA